MGILMKALAWISTGTSDLRVWLIYHRSSWRATPECCLLRPVKHGNVRYKAERQEMTIVVVFAEYMSLFCGVGNYHVLK